MSVILEIERPASLPEALAILAEGLRQQRPWIPLAVDSGLSVWCEHNGLVLERVLDIGRIPGLHDVSESESEIHIGALTSFKTLRRSPLVHSYAPALKSAAVWHGTPPSPVLPTLGGSLVDGLPSQLVAAVLASLEVELTLASEQGLRLLPLSALYDRNENAIFPDELLLRVSIQKATSSSHQRFLRVGVWDGDGLTTLAIAFEASKDEMCRLTGIVVALGEVPEPPQPLSLSGHLDPAADYQEQAETFEQLLIGQLDGVTGLTGKQRHLLPRLVSLVRRDVWRFLRESAPESEV